MQKNKKKLFVLICLIISTLIVCTLVFVIKPKTNDINAQNSSQDEISNLDAKYILENYPIDDVPLYDGITISSMKYIVNEDSTNVYDKFFGAKRNYYNVVFDTDAKKVDVFNFYKSKMSEINDEDYQNEDTVEGVIGEYRVSISNYGYEDFYLQVHLPVSKYSKNNKYYEDYPKLIEIASDWVEYENSYGLLNQKGGEIEYTQWFELPYVSYENDSLEKIDRIRNYYDLYKQKYENKTVFASNDESGTLTWSETSYEVTAVFSSDHGRIYLMFRKPMK